MGAGLFSFKISGGWCYWYAHRRFCCKWWPPLQWVLPLKIMRTGHFVNALWNVSKKGSNFQLRVYIKCQKTGMKQNAGGQIFFSEQWLHFFTYFSNLMENHRRMLYTTHECTMYSMCICMQMWRGNHTPVSIIAVLPANEWHVRCEYYSLSNMQLCAVLTGHYNYISGRQFWHRCS